MHRNFKQVKEMSSQKCESIFANRKCEAIFVRAEILQNVQCHCTHCIISYYIKKAQYLVLCGGDNRIRSQLVDSADLPSKTGASDDPQGHRFDKVKSVRLHAFESVFNNKKTTHGRFSLVVIIGLEPKTPCLQGRCSSQLSHTPII